MNKLVVRYKNWKYKNTALLILSFIVLFFLTKNEAVLDAIRSLGQFGYISAFFVGIFFVSTFTVAPSALVLYYLAGTLNPVGVALVAGAGAVVGDLLIFKFLKDGVFQELAPLFSKLKGSYVGNFFSTPYFSWFIPILGAIIIASPFPDEAGISLMGLSKIKTWQFAILAFFLNSTGIFFITTLARSVN